MPKTTKSGSPVERELPAALASSEKNAQRIFAQTYESVYGEHGDEKQARTAAYAALEHRYEKIGDHWEPKTPRSSSGEHSGRRGPDTTG